MSNTEVMKQSAVKLAGKHPKNKIHRTAGDIAFDVFLYILFVAFTILCVFPFYYLFINTISSNDAVAGGLVNFWPVGIHFQNYLALRDSGHSADGDCQRVGGLSGHEAENVASVADVPRTGHHHVLQRGPDSVVHEHADAGADEQLPCLHPAGHDCTVQHHSGEDVH